MFDIGMAELLLVGIVALIVVGPKDLPKMFHTVGRFTGKAKGMAREFSRAMNDAAESTGVNDLGKDLRDATSHNSLGLKQLDDIADRFDNWKPGDNSTDLAPKGSETAKLSEERAATAKKIQDATAKKALERQAAEAEQAASDTKAAPKSATKKPAAKKAAAKKPAAKKATSRPAASKPAASKAAAAKPAAKAKKPAAKKPAAKKPAKKPSASK